MPSLPAPLWLSPWWGHLHSLPAGCFPGFLILVWQLTQNTGFSSRAPRQPCPGHHPESSLQAVQKGLLCPAPLPFVLSEHAAHQARLLLSTFYGKEPACQCRRHKRQGFDPWVGKIPWRRQWQPTPAFLLENPLDRGAWWAAVPEVTQSHTQLSAHTQGFWLPSGWDPGESFELGSP